MQWKQGLFSTTGSSASSGLLGIGAAGTASLSFTFQVAGSTVPAGLGGDSRCGGGECFYANVSVTVTAVPAPPASDGSSVSIPTVQDAQTQMTDLINTIQNDGPAAPQCSSVYRVCLLNIWPGSWNHGPFPLLVLAVQIVGNDSSASAYSAKRLLTGRSSGSGRPPPNWKYSWEPNSRRRSSGAWLSGPFSSYCVP